jgi:hypothetical protein
MAIAVKGHKRIYDLAKALGFPKGGYVWNLVSRGQLPAPTHEIGYYRAKFYTDDEFNKIVASMPRAEEQ